VQQLPKVPDFCRVFKNTRRLKDMKQYILSGKNSFGTVDSHIEDYRTKERMEEGFSRIKETFRNTPHAKMMEESDRHFKVKIGRVTFEYYITEREI
jgi:hypothetical protein